MEVLVAKDGKIEFLQGIGIANRETNSKISKFSTFRIASMTKAFTAVLILQLYEKGKLDLNSFRQIFPDLQRQCKKCSNHRKFTNLQLRNSGQNGLILA
jgi:hypothetical protein